MDQKVTVYIQLGAMNGNIFDGGKIIALSKQLQIKYKQYQPPSFEEYNKHNHLAFFFALDCKLHIKYPTKHYYDIFRLKKLKWALYFCLV